MYVDVVSIHEGKALVKSIYGEAIAEFVGFVPKIGSQYYVELQVNDDLVWGVDIVNSKQKTSRLTIKLGSTEIIAQIESIDPDGVLCLRIGLDTILLIEITNLPTTLAPGAFVELITSNLMIFDQRF